MTVTVLVPVLGRPHRVQPLLSSLHAATPEPHDVLFICDPDDYPTHREIAAAHAEKIAPGGSYAAKINAGIKATDTDEVFLGADDLAFHPGWLTAARAHLRNGVEVVGVNDLCSERVRAGRHATHFLMTRAYAQRPAIDGGPGPLCEAYRHSYVDDELVATARSRGVLAFATDSLVEHLHPDAGKSAWDATYEMGRRSMRADNRIYRRRMREWT